MGGFATQSTDLDNQFPRPRLTDRGRLDAACSFGKATIKSRYDTALGVDLKDLEEQWPVLKDTTETLRELDSSTSAYEWKCMALALESQCLRDILRQHDPWLVWCDKDFRILAR